MKGSAVRIRASASTPRRDGPKKVPPEHVASAIEHDRAEVVVAGFNWLLLYADLVSPRMTEWAIARMQLAGEQRPGWRLERAQRVRGDSHGLSAAQGGYRHDADCRPRVGGAGIGGGEQRTLLLRGGRRHERSTA
jgi:hypothetical protein